MKVEPIVYGDRKVYTVAAFNRGVADWLQRLPTLWIEGEVTDLRRQAGWQTVFFTLKDPESDTCLSAAMPRGQFDALRLDLVNGERVHVYGRPELWTQKGELSLPGDVDRAIGHGEHLVALERLKAKLAADGLFAESCARCRAYEEESDWSPGTTPRAAIVAPRSVPFPRLDRRRRDAGAGCAA
jgi:exonuclease VII large subunit